MTRSLDFVLNQVDLDFLVVVILLFLIQTR